MTSVGVSRGDAEVQRGGQAVLLQTRVGECMQTLEAGEQAVRQLSRQ